MEIFHQSFQYSPSNFFDFICTIYATIFAAECLNIKILINFMDAVMLNFKINAQVCTSSIADLNLGHCVELTFCESKLGGFLVIRSS